MADVIDGILIGSLTIDDGSLDRYVLKLPLLASDVHPIILYFGEKFVNVLLQETEPNRTCTRCMEEEVRRKRRREKGGGIFE